MTLTDIRDILDAEVLYGEDLLDREVKTGFASDLISEMLAHANSGTLLITSLTNPHSIHTALVTDAAGIVFVGGKKPSLSMIRAVNSSRIPLLATDHFAFKCCALLSGRGIQEELHGASSVAETAGVKNESRLVIEFPIHEKDFLMAGEAASKTKKALQQLGLKTDVVKNTAIIVYEAAMNVVIHANHGHITIVIVPEEVLVISEDAGPGIADIELAMQEGYSTAPHEIQEMGFGAGMGLPNIKRCSDELKIRSESGIGTVLEARIHLRQKEDLSRTEG